MGVGGVQVDTIKRVEALLEERGMTPFAFFKGQKVGVSYSTFNATAKRGGQLSVESIEKICQALGITLGEFFWIPGVTAPEKKECDPLSDEEIIVLRRMIAGYLAQESGAGTTANE